MATRTSVVSRWVLVVLVAAALLVGVESKAQKSPENVKSVPLKVGRFIAPTIILIGEQQGAFSDLSLSTFDVSSGAQALPLLTTGDLAAAVDVSEPPMVIAFSKDIKFKIVWLTTFTPEALIVQKGISDVRGKTISTPTGSIGQYLLERYLEKHNLTLSDIKYADLQEQDALAAFTRGKIDGLYAFAPISTQAEAAGGTSLDSARVFNYVDLLPAVH